MRRLSSVLAHVTELPYALPVEADVSLARQNVQRWQDFWDAHGADYALRGVALPAGRIPGGLMF